MVNTLKLCTLKGGRFLDLITSTRLEVVYEVNYAKPEQL
jgi:hypothetical protein